MSTDDGIVATALLFAGLLTAVLLTIFTMTGHGFAQEVDLQGGDSSSYHLSEFELEIWNDPEFQRQFIESYKAETDIEPRVTTGEREKMQEVLQLISSDQMDQAAEILKKALGEAAQAEEAAEVEEKPKKKSFFSFGGDDEEEEEEGEGGLSAVFDFTLANIYFQQEKLDEAAEYYNTAVEKFPKFRRAWKNLGLIFIRQNKFEKALPALTRVIELGGNDSISFGLLGYAYSSVENFLSAESAYRMAILLDPKTLDWKMGLARSFFKQERYPEAVALCSQLIKKEPDNADLWMLQANAYIGMDQPMEAAEIYEFIDELEKSTVDTLNMLGDIYTNEGLYELAVDSYIEAMQQDPEASVQRPMRSARVLAARGAFEETTRLIEHIEEFAGDRLAKNERKDLLKLRARIAVAQGAGGEQVEVLKEIVELDPLDGEALILLGQHYSRSGEPQKAVFYYERAANIEEYEADAKVRHAQLLVQQGKYADALPLLRSAQAIKPRENIQDYLEDVERVAKSR